MDLSGEKPALDGKWTLTLALVLAAAIYGLREAADNPNEGLTLLYVLPIALVATRFGGRAGVLAALVAMALFGVWEHTNDDVDINAVGYITRATAFLVLGGLLGRSAAQRQKLVLELRERSRTDPLTGLLNHASFYAELSRELALAQRSGRSGALIVTDLNGFKEVNDRYGHVVGDEVLKFVADVLRQAVRGGDTVARVGGDEFAVLMPEIEGEAAAAAARRIAGLLDGSERHVPGGSPPVGVSVGVTTFDRSAELTSKQAFAAADLAMYDAKRSRELPTARR